jgi:acyl-CoA thioesterase I
VHRVYGAPAGLLQRLMVMVLLASAAASAWAASAPLATRPTVLVMGDSLSAGYGLANGQGWVALTAARLPASNPGWKLVNASISGETSAGGAARIEAELARHHPRVLVLALGANDGLRGLPIAQMRANLEHIVVAAQNSGARVLMVGMRMPPNLGGRYTREFEACFAALAKQHHTAFLPFLLAPIAADRRNFQEDDLHPVAAAQPKLRDHVWTQLGPLLSAKPAAPPPPAHAAKRSGG